MAVERDAMDLDLERELSAVASRGLLHGVGSAF